MTTQEWYALYLRNRHEKKVRIFAGPLIGIEGIVRWIHGISRVVVSITAIEQSVSILVPAELLKTIPTGKE
jgi:transcription antitermination factor NusG